MSNPEFFQGVEQFNQQEYYACHDTLEALWMEALEPDKRFYQGILQISVAFYHLGNNNYNGAIILLGEGIARLRYYQPVYLRIDINQFLQDNTEVLKILQQIETTKIDQFDRNQLPLIQLLIVEET